MLGTFTVLRIDLIGIITLNKVNVFPRGKES